MSIPNSVAESFQYEASPSSAYWYWKGLNWRAPVAWAVGVAPVFPGFLSTVSTVTVPIGVTRVYYLCFPREWPIIGCQWYSANDL